MAELGKGDVFKATRGMRIQYERFPVKLFPKESIYSDRLADACIEIGEVYTNRTDAKPERWAMRRDVVELFSKHEIPFSEDIVTRFINNQVKDPQAIKLVIPEGYYIVTSVEIIRGTPTHHKVRCKAYQAKSIQQEFEFYFYQKSHFTSNNDRIEVTSNKNEDEKPRPTFR